MSLLDPLTPEQEHALCVAADYHTQHEGVTTRVVLNTPLFSRTKRQRTTAEYETTVANLSKRQRHMAISFQADSQLANTIDLTSLPTSPSPSTSPAISFLAPPVVGSPKVSRMRTTVVRLRRKHGVLAQSCDVYIGRACSRGGWNLPQSKWHNPFSVRACGSAAVAVERFERYLLTKPDLMRALAELKGKVLGCWCKETGAEPCHGDILAKWADRKDVP